MEWIFCHRCPKPTICVSPSICPGGASSLTEEWVGINAAMLRLNAFINIPSPVFPSLTLLHAHPTLTYLANTKHGSPAHERSQ